MTSVEAQEALAVINAHTRDWGIANVIELIDTSNPDLTVDEILDLTVEVVGAVDAEGYAWSDMIVAEEVLSYLEDTPAS
jgi:hypothetical protein